MEYFFNKNGDTNQKYDNVQILCARWIHIKKILETSKYVRQIKENDFQMYSRTYMKKNQVGWKEKLMIRSCTKILLIVPRIINKCI